MLLRNKMLFGSTWALPIAGNSATGGIVAFIQGQQWGGKEGTVAREGTVAWEGTGPLNTT